MFNRKMLVAMVLVLGVGAYSVAQVQKNRAKVLPLSQSDRKLQKCQLHGVTLKVDSVRIHYGIVGFPGGYYQASQRKFPNARSVIMGGCVIPPGSPEFQTVKYCPLCRVAEKRWANAQKKTLPRG